MAITCACGMPRRKLVERKEKAEMANNAGVACPGACVGVISDGRERESRCGKFEKTGGLLSIKAATRRERRMKERWDFFFWF